MKILHNRIFGMVAFLIALFITGARANNVDEANAHMRALLRFLEEHGYGLIEVQTDFNQEIVRSKINGENVHMLIDSGCEQTCLTQDCAKYLDLDLHQTNHSVNGVGGVVGGKVSEALTRSFTLNGYEINRTNPIQVLPPHIGLGKNDGMFGADCLHRNAVLMPVGTNHMLFKPGDGAVPVLAPFLTQLGYSPVPLTTGKGGLHAKAELNGQPVDVIVDSGAAYSYFDVDLVRKISKSTLWPTGVTLYGIDGNRQLNYAFDPTQLSVGSIQMKPQMLCAGKAPSFKYSGFQGLLGFDLLIEHHAIIDFGHDVLWMKP